MLDKFSNQIPPSRPIQPGDSIGKSCGSCALRYVKCADECYICREKMTLQNPYPLHRPVTVHPCDGCGPSDEENHKGS